MERHQRLRGDPDTLLRPTWSGRELLAGDMGPFGGVPIVGKARETELIAGLDAAVRQEIEQATAQTAALLSEVMGR